MANYLKLPTNKEKGIFKRHGRLTRIKRCKKKTNNAKK
jgi:hypothetical protein